MGVKWYPFMILLCISLLISNIDLEADQLFLSILMYLFLDVVDSVYHMLSEWYQYILSKVEKSSTKH